MKPITDKEVLYSQGEWMHENKFNAQLSGSLDIYTQSATIARCLCNDVSIEEMNANAEMICKAVNERQRLLDSNKELFETVRVLKLALRAAEIVFNASGGYSAKEQKDLTDRIHATLIKYGYEYNNRNQ